MILGEASVSSLTRFHICAVISLEPISGCDLEYESVLHCAYTYSSNPVFAWATDPPRSLGSSVRLSYRLPGSLVVKPRWGVTGLVEIRLVWWAHGPREPCLLLRFHRADPQQPPNTGLSHLPDQCYLQLWVMRKRRSQRKLWRGGTSEMIHPRYSPYPLRPTQSSWLNHVPHEGQDFCLSCAIAKNNTQHIASLQ